MKMLVGIVVYILISAVATFALLVFSTKAEIYDPEWGFLWPVVCGIFWLPSWPYRFRNYRGTNVFKF